MVGFLKILVFMELKLFENKKCGVSIDLQPQGSANSSVGHSQNLGLIHTTVKTIMINIQKRLCRSQLKIFIIYIYIYIYIYGNFS